MEDSPVDEVQSLIDAVDEKISGMVKGELIYDEDDFEKLRSFLTVKTFLRDVQRDYRERLESGEELDTLEELQVLKDWFDLRTPGLETGDSLELDAAKVDVFKEINKRLINYNGESLTRF